MTPLRPLLALLLASCAPSPTPASGPPSMTKPPPTPPAPHIDQRPFVLPPGTHAKLQHGPTLSVVEVTTRSFILVVEVTGYQRPVRLPMDLGDNRTLWTPDGFRITVDELAGPKLHAERVTDQVVGEPVFARVERGGRVTVSPELAMTFLGHGHKRTLEGERSPLMVSVAFHAARAATEEAHYNAGGESPSPPPRFQWRDYRFVVVDYGYDTFMKLRIERLAFEQISLE